MEVAHEYRLHRVPTGISQMLRQPDQRGGLNPCEACQLARGKRRYLDGVIDQVARADLELRSQARKAGLDVTDQFFKRIGRRHDSTVRPVKDDPRIQHLNTARRGPYGVQIQLSDFRVCGTQAGYAKHQLDQGAAIHRGSASYALQNGMRLDAVHHRTSVLFTDGQGAEDNVMQNLNENPTQPEHQDGAVAGIADDANDDLQAVRRIRHGRDQHAPDVRARNGSANARDNSMERAFYAR